jgi:hypothetical protein
MWFVLAMMLIFTVTPLLYMLTASAYVGKRHFENALPLDTSRIIYPNYVKANSG